MHSKRIRTRFRWRSSRWRWRKVNINWLKIQLILPETNMLELSDIDVGQIPTLLWHGSADTDVPVAVGRYVAEHIKGCEATIIAQPCSNVHQPEY